ncbi:beta-N-acetylhexosaminidase [Pseudoalteromonas phenolica]|uniref:Beta-N-acetylhexosaminidase n=1 Tax=Pseudoalteromonas phenolica TaxID=161398 RepID=A0A5R9Q4X6_9GAMM|nr:family 20 glycosylhydrolase [Pseudoalteromonas phenolica]TLX47427.1 beta-N-acetylhexosaminidase [Pseudoalteromonas phenolica]
MRSKHTGFIFLSILFLNCFLPSAQASLKLNMASLDNAALMPMPKQLDIKKSSLKLESSLSVHIEGMSEQRKRFQLQRFQSHLNRVGNSTFTVFEDEKQNAHLTIDIQQQEQGLSVPQYGEDESYKLIVNQRGIRIEAQSVFGAQHALTTLVQLVYSQQKNVPAKSAVFIPNVVIQDTPRFAWRGLLIDSVRHFLPISSIKRQLKGMAAAKLNVFHWHLTDDQGWRIESKAYPLLTAKASDGDFYTQADIKEVVEYASLLGIRVLPEIGMPGHASAIAVAYPQLMTKDKTYDMERHWGVFKPLLDIANPKVYEFIDTLIGEMVTLFPEQYFHIGGDEVDAEHWLEDEHIRLLMSGKNLQNGADLQNYFNSKIQPIIAKHHRQMAGWDEIFHPQLPKQILVQSWRGHDSLNAVAKAGYQGVLSTGFYIDQPQYTDYHYRNDPHLVSPLVDLTHPKSHAKQFVIERLKGSPVKGELLILGEQVLIKLNNNHHQLAKRETELALEEHLAVQFDSWMGPLSFEFDFAKSTGFVLIGNSRYPFTISELTTPKPITLAPALSSKQQALILGGEATMWSEMITKDNIDVRVWPRLFAIAERLWSPAEVKQADNMYARLDVISEYADQVIGLLHFSQQQSGWAELIPPNLTKQQQDETLALLNTLALLLEPSHYYTRHHIKHLNDEYHQLAPLDLFVDFLAVESKEVRFLKEHVKAYIAGNTRALTDIEQRLEQWQRALNAEQGLLAKSEKLKSLQTTYENLQRFANYTQRTIEVCQGKQQTENLDERLLALQALTDELVIAGIYPVRRLFLHCAAVQHSELKQD